MTENDKHWLAGLLEGEGTFGTAKNWVAGKCYRYPKIAVTMTDEDVIQRVCFIFGVKIYCYDPKPPSKKILYRACKVGTAVIEIMKDLKPLMGTRRQSQIEKSISDWDLQPKGNDARSSSMAVFVKSRTRDSFGYFQ